MADEIVNNEEVVEESPVQDEAGTIEIPDEVEADEKAEETSDDSDELSEEDVKLAKSLLKNLRDPGKGKQTAAELAKAFGVTLEVDKKGEVTAVDKKTGEEVDIDALVNENLPEGWKTMGPILSKILAQYRDKVIAPKLTKNDIEKHTERSESAVEFLKNKYKDVDTLGDAMNEISQSVRPSKLETQADYNRYAEQIYKLAKGSVGDNGNTSLNLANIVKKTINNAKRATPGPSDVTRVKQDIHAKTPDEAVSLALRTLAGQSRKK